MSTIAFAIILADPCVALAQSSDQGLVEAGEVSVASGPIARNGLIASIPARHAQRSILKEAAETPSLRMSAETEVYATRFGTGSESVLAWCGKGQKRLALSWVNQSVCYVQTPDAQATLAAGFTLFRPAPSWFVSTLNFADNDFRFARKRVDPDPRPGPLLEMKVFVAKIQGNRVWLSRRMKGPPEPGAESDVNLLVETTLDVSEPRTFKGLQSSIELRLLDARSVGARLVELALATLPIEVNMSSTQPVAQPPVPPRAKPTDFVVQGLYMSPHGMQVWQGVIANRGVLARGPARLWQTATVPPETTLGGFGRRVSAYDGLVLQKVETFNILAAGLREKDAFWCGVFTTRVFGSDVPIETCFKNTENGGTKIESPDPVRNLPRENQLIDATNLVVPQFQDGSVAVTTSSNIPPDDFLAEVKLAGISRRTVSISIVGIRNGISESIFFIELPWSADGRVRIPFWTHSLVLSREVAGVTAQWLADNSGLGPVELRAIQESQGR